MVSSGGMMSSPFTLFREQDVRDRSSDDLVQALGDMLLDATYSYELLKRDVERITRDMGDVTAIPAIVSQLDAISGDDSGAGGGVLSGLHSELTLDDGTNPHGTTASDLGLATVATTGSYSDLSGVPAAFNPTQHTLFGSSHSGFTMTSLSDGDGLAYDGSTWVNLPVLRRIDDMWTIAGATEEVLELLSGSDVIFRNRSGTTLSAASEASAIGWAYSATRYIGLGYYGGNLALTDGTSVGPDGDNPITYTPHATNASRALEFNVKTTWNGSDYSFTGLPVEDPAASGRIWDNNGYLCLSGADELSDLAFSGSWSDIVDAPYSIGEIWAENIAGVISVEQPGAPILHEGRYYPTALYFGVATGGGVDLAMTRNVLPDPEGEGEVASDDIELTFRLANAPQGTVKGRALGSGEGVPTDLSPAQVAAIVADGGGVLSGLHSDLTLDDGTNPHGTTASDLGLATVATTGSYSNLSDVPSLATVATTGSYTDLSDVPSLATVATTGSYTDLSDVPSLATVATTGSYTDLTDVPSLATVATTGSYSDLTGVPSTFAPSSHALFGSAHSGFTMTSLSDGDGLAYNGSTWVNLPVLRRVDTMWTISGSTDVLEMLSGSDIIFRNRSGTTTSAASGASTVGWAYSATRYAGFGYYDGNLTLVDGTYTGGPSGDDPLTYKPNATNTSRELEFKVKTTWKGDSADLVIDGTLLDDSDKAMAIREIDVCVDGDAKKMLVLASEPY